MRYFIFIPALFSILFSFNISASANDDVVPLEHQGHCRVWKDGKCAEGLLTDMAKQEIALQYGANATENSQGTNSERCETACNEACPKCHNCDLCGFCDFYHDDACQNVLYFSDKETCQEKRTRTCCDLCSVHCSGDGTCSPQGICNGGDAKTSKFAHCIEKVDGKKCLPCAR